MGIDNKSAKTVIKIISENGWDCFVEEKVKQAAVKVAMENLPVRIIKLIFRQAYILLDGRNNLTEKDILFNVHKSTSNDVSTDGEVSNSSPTGTSEDKGSQRIKNETEVLSNQHDPEKQSAYNNGERSDLEDDIARLNKRTLQTRPPDTRRACPYEPSQSNQQNMSSSKHKPGIRNQNYVNDIGRKFMNLINGDHTADNAYDLPNDSSDNEGSDVDVEHSGGSGDRGHQSLIRTKFVPLHNPNDIQDKNVASEREMEHVNKEIAAKTLLNLSQQVKNMYNSQVYGKTPFRNDPLSQSSGDDCPVREPMHNLYDQISHHRNLFIDSHSQQQEQQQNGDGNFQTAFDSNQNSGNGSSGSNGNSRNGQNGDQQNRDQMPNTKDKQPIAAFPCPVAGCTVTLAKKSYVKKHLETHTKHRSYGCDMCDVTCRQYAGLYVHYKGVHKKKLKACNVRRIIGSVNISPQSTAQQQPLQNESIANPAPHLDQGASSSMVNLGYPAHSDPQNTAPMYRRQLTIAASLASSSSAILSNQSQQPRQSLWTQPGSPPTLQSLTRLHDNNSSIQTGRLQSTMPSKLPRLDDPPSS